VNEYWDQVNHQINNQLNGRVNRQMRAQVEGLAWVLARSGVYYQALDQITEQIAIQVKEKLGE